MKVTATKVRFLVGALLCSPAPAVAQTNTVGTIRVESNEVFVPVLVVDDQRLKEVQHKFYALRQRAKGGLGAVLDPLTVQGLSLKDFTVLEDGEQQRIVSVLPEVQALAPIVRDNLGAHREFVGVGGGTWSLPLWESIWPRVDETTVLSGYAIGFIPSASLDGSCHQLQILVDRPNSLVLSRNRYCQTSGNGADPLRDTVVGRQIESHLRGKNNNDLSLYVAAIPLFADNGKTRVRVVLDYKVLNDPVTASCDTTPTTVGIIGSFLGLDGREVLRFSDEATGWYDESPQSAFALKVTFFDKDEPCEFYVPFRYETEVEIPPGQYRLQIGFLDDQTFGRTGALVTVPPDAGEQLSISGIVLARRFRDVQLQPPGLPVGVSPMPFADTRVESANSVTALPGRYLPLITKDFEVTPTAESRFKRKDRFYFYVQVYEPRRSKTPRPLITLGLRIVNSKTGEVVRQLQPVNAAPYELPDNPVVPIGGGILVAELRKGAYTLQAQATDSTGASTKWQSVDFAVE
jgi:hypothetical protein